MFTLSHRNLNFFLSTKSDASASPLRKAELPTFPISSTCTYVMESTPPQTEPHLRPQSSTLSSSSIGSVSTFVGSPPSPSIRRPGYHRVPSVVEEGDGPSLDKVLHETSNASTGLGIANLDEQEPSSVTGMTRVPVGSKSPTSQPDSADPLISPVSTKGTPRTFCDGESPYKKFEQNTPHDLTSTSYQPFVSDSERERLRQGPSSGFGKDQNLHCRSRKPLGTSRNGWLPISLLIMSIYSTIFSGIWFFTAIVRPRFSHWIVSHHIRTEHTASVVCAAFAKSIELTFVTVIIACIGQILSKRALGERKSITIAEMSMRSWVLQPGTMVAHWESVRYAAVTYLGAAALIAALLAVLYTTASDALVAPKLIWGSMKNQMLWGKVSTSWANTFTIQDRCPTPIQPMNDPTDYATTCIQLEHAGQAYHNYLQYLQLWTESISVGNGSDEMDKRPPPVAVCQH